MTVHLHFVEQGTPEWRAARDDKYTGSNADKLLGDIGVREYAKNKDSGFGGNFYTERGHMLEDEALELYEAITGKKILRDENGIKVGYVTNDLYPDAQFSPDGWLEADTDPFIEVKAFELDKHMELIKGNIPLKVMAQIQFGLTISKKPYAQLVPYNPKAERVEDKFKIIRIPRNKAAIANFDRKLKELSKVPV